MTRVFAFALSVVLVVATALSAPAAELSGIILPDTAVVHGQTLVCNGLAMRKKLFIEVYVGGLYLSQRQTEAAPILNADEPRRMVMHFVRSVGADSIREAWIEGVRNNVPNPSAELMSRVDELNTLMADMREGDDLVLDYVPGQGVTVAVGSSIRGTIPGKDLADALLSTWIGPKPGPGASFKKAILGGE